MKLTNKSGEDVEVNRLEICPFCKSRKIREGNSLHCWDIEFDCGLVVVGSIEKEDCFIEEECKYSR